MNEGDRVIARQHAGHGRN